MSKVVHLSDVKNDATLIGKRELLEKALSVVDDKNTPIGRANKLLILTVNHEDGLFDVNFMNSHMNTVEIIAACTVMQSLAQRFMGYVATMNDVCPCSLEEEP